MSVTLSLFVKSSIYTCSTDMYKMINHLHQKYSGLIDPFEKLHETKIRVIEIAIRCAVISTKLISLFHFFTSGEENVRQKGASLLENW